MPDADGYPTIDELPDRMALRRRIAEKIAFDQREFAADDPERRAPQPVPYRSPVIRHAESYFGHAAGDGMVASHDLARRR